MIMRKTGLCLALVASSQLALSTTFSAAAFADDKPVAPAPAAPASGPAPAVGTVLVHIKSDEPVTLQHRANENAAWETSCSTPCDLPVPVGDEFQVTGDGLNASKPFHLDASKGKVTLDVTAGKKSSQKVGVGVAIGGAALGVAGILVMALGAPPSETFDGQTTHTAHTNDLFIGGALVLGGVIFGIYGGAMIVNNGNSDVAGDVSKPAPVYGKVDDGPSKIAQSPVPNVPTFVAPVLHFNF
jgi:hypothetical protein